jgi:predicted DCC family thiol-disulfide oxidoreductase YuxK
MATLYYDGKCPLCSREIALLRRLQWRDLDFADVHSLSEYSEERRHNMLKVLHLRDQTGRWYTGVEATVMAWSYTPYGWLFKPLRWPIIRKVVDRVYNIWAARRYAKLYACGVCQAASH